MRNTASWKDMQRAAGLYCGGLSVEDVALELSLDVDETQHLIEAAEEKELFIRRPELRLECLDDDIDEYLRNSMLTATLRNELQDKFQLSGISLHITPSPRSMYATFD